MESEVKDKAERLHVLITKMQSVSANGTRSGEALGLPGPAGARPLWEAFGVVVSAMGYDDYGRFRDSFLSLTSSIRNDVAVIPLQKERVRESWLNCIDQISRVFDAKNFGLQTAQVFANHFTARNMEILDSISERFQAASFEDTSDSDIQSALETMREAIDAFTSNTSLDPRIAKVLKHYLQQIETVYSQVNDFGDEMFWKIYKETFATFMQIHPVIAGLDNADVVKSKIGEVAKRLTLKTIAGVSLAADLATIGAATYGLLGH